MSPVPLPPCKAIRPVSDENAAVRGRSGPDKGLPAGGAYLRVSGPSGPLTSVYGEVQRFLLIFISSQVLNCQLLNRGGPFGVPIQWLTIAHKIPLPDQWGLKAMTLLSYNIHN